MQLCTATPRSRFSTSPRRLTSCSKTTSTSPRTCSPRLISASLTPVSLPRTSRAERSRERSRPRCARFRRGRARQSRLARRKPPPQVREMVATSHLIDPLTQLMSTHCLHTVYTRSAHCIHTVHTTIYTLSTQVLPCPSFLPSRAGLIHSLGLLVPSGTRTTPARPNETNQGNRR
jgi:hypothetical protein